MSATPHQSIVAMAGELAGKRERQKEKKGRKMDLPPSRGSVSPSANT